MRLFTAARAEEYIGGILAGCGTEAAGFGYQESVALHPTAPGDDFTRQQPSRRG